MYTTLANYQLTTFLAKYRLTVNPIRTLTQGKFKTDFKMYPTGTFH